MQAARNVLIVDSHRLFAEAISRVLKEQGMSHVELATSTQEAITAAFCKVPDLVLVDLDLRDAGGLETSKELLHLLPKAKVVVMSDWVDERVLPRVRKSGFHGYLTKSTPLLRFTESVSEILNGRKVFPNGGDRSASRTDEAEQLAAAQLTQREREILLLLAQGARSADICHLASITPNTARSHIQSILSKLQVHSRLEAVAFAFRHGLIDRISERNSA